MRGKRRDRIAVMRCLPEIDTRGCGASAGKLDHAAKLTEVLVVNDRVESVRLRLDVSLVRSSSSLYGRVHHWEDHQHAYVQHGDGGLSASLQCATQFGEVGFAQIRSVQ